MAHKERFGLPLALAMVLGMAAAAQSPTSGLGQPAGQAVSMPCARPDRGAVPESRIAADWHASSMMIVPVSKPPLPNGSTDLGVAPAGMRLERMLLLLEPSPTQQSALDTELANQQTTASCAFHQW